MFGVVLWSNVNERKAVIWCEDQGDLAFFDGSNDWHVAAQPDFFDSGDIVSFDVAVNQNLRKAINAKLVQEQVCAGLPDALRRDADRPARSGKVVPFGVPKKSRALVGSAKMKIVTG